MPPALSGKVCALVAKLNREQRAAQELRVQRQTKICPTQHGLAYLVADLQVHDAPCRTALDGLQSSDGTDSIAAPRQSGTNVLQGERRRPMQVRRSGVYRGFDGAQARMGCGPYIFAVLGGARGFGEVVGRDQCPITGEEQPPCVIDSLVGPRVLSAIALVLLIPDILCRDIVVVGALPRPLV